MQLATDFLQGISVVVAGRLGFLTIVAVYCPSKHAIKKEPFQKFYRTFGSRFVARGDYNAKHHHGGSRVINPKGRQLYYAMASNNFKFISTRELT